jgi:hypothetical protein
MHWLTIDRLPGVGGCGPALSDWRKWRCFRKRSFRELKSFMVLSTFYSVHFAFCCCIFHSREGVLSCLLCSTVRGQPSGKKLNPPRHIHDTGVTVPQSSLKGPRPEQELAGRRRVLHVEPAAQFPRKASLARSTGACLRSLGSSR